jgi:hypothetical protein
MLGFASNRTKLSALWSRGSWPNYSCMRSYAIWGFECWSSLASLLVSFQLSVWAVRCCSHLARLCEVFHSWGQDVFAKKIKWIQCKQYFVIWKYMSTKCSPLTEVLASWVNEADNCWCLLCSSASARNCQCSTSPRVFSRYHIYIFSKGGRNSIMSKTNTGSNSNEYY